MFRDHYLFRKDSSPDAKSDWFRHRYRSYIVYLLTYLIYGFEVGLTDATLWIYVAKSMNVERKMLYFGIMIAIEYLPLICLSTIVSRYADKSRRISFWMTFLNLLVIIGNVAYTVPLSPYLALSGRFLVGFSKLLQPLIVGEIARSYDRKLVGRKIPLCNVLFHIGKGLGPLVAIGFTSVDFWIGNIHVTYGNISALCLLLLAIILQFGILLFHYDISHEYDMKGAEEDRVCELYNECGSDDQNSSALDVIVKLIINFDTLLILCLGFISSMWSKAAKLVIPIIVTENLHYHINIANISFVACAVLTGVIVFTLSWFNINKYMYYYGVVSLTSIIINYICLRLISNGLTFKSNMMLLIAHAFFLSLGEIGEDIFLVVTFTKLVSGKYQCFGEGVRDTVLRAGAVIGAGISAFVYFHIEWTFAVAIASIGFLVVWLLLRSKSLKDPRIVVW